MPDYRIFLLHFITLFAKKLKLYYEKDLCSRHTKTVSFFYVNVNQSYRFCKADMGKYLNRLFSVCKQDSEKANEREKNGLKKECERHKEENRMRSKKKKAKGLALAGLHDGMWPKWRPFCMFTFVCTPILVCFFV